jgi:putative Holliday junction resolvase
VADLVREHAVTRVVVGEPRSMDGSRGTRAEAALDFAEALRNALDVPVDLQDERLSTVEGTKRLREAGVPSRRSKRVVDAAAAQVILQAWLDAR